MEVYEFILWVLAIASLIHDIRYSFGFDLGLIPKRRAEYKLRPELFKFL